MLPDRVSDPGPLTYEGRCPTDCATRHGVEVVWTFCLSSINSFFFLPLSGRRPGLVVVFGLGLAAL